MSKILRIGLGEDCPKCGRQMERRAHGAKPKTEFFFTEWDVCHGCHHIQHYEKYKSRVWKDNEILLKEDQQKLDFISHL